MGPGGPLSEVNRIRKLCLASLLLARPGMFTSGGTLAEVLALLDGYCLAWREGRSGGDESPVHMVNEFQSQFDQSILAAPAERMRRILERFGSEDQALDALRQIAARLDPP
jgi:hypothetical protein